MQDVKYGGLSQKKKNLHFLRSMNSQQFKNEFGIVAAKSSPMKPGTIKTKKSQISSSNKMKDDENIVLNLTNKNINFKGITRKIIDLKKSR